MHLIDFYYKNRLNSHRTSQASPPHQDVRTQPFTSGNGIAATNGCLSNTTKSKLQASATTTKKTGNNTVKRQHPGILQFVVVSYSKGEKTYIAKS